MGIIKSIVTIIIVITGRKGASCIIKNVDVEN